MVKIFFFRLPFFIQFLIATYYDNASILYFILKNNKRSTASEHIEIIYLVIRDTIKEGHEVIEHISTETMIVDPLTNGVAPRLFNEMWLVWMC